MAPQRRDLEESDGFDPPRRGHDCTWPRQEKLVISELRRQHDWSKDIDERTHANTTEIAVIKAKAMMLSAGIGAIVSGVVAWIVHLMTGAK